MLMPRTKAPAQVYTYVSLSPVLVIAAKFWHSYIPGIDNNTGMDPVKQLSWAGNIVDECTLQEGFMDWTP